MPTATGSSPSHHVTLSAADGTGSTYGLVLCNVQGIPNARAIERNPSNRTSIKMQQGSTKYADLQGDYISIPQDDWTGGRGAEDFDDDSSRFFDSYRMNTWMPGRAILGPQVQYTTGYRAQNMNMPGSVTFTGLYGATRFLANKFTASVYNADKCYIWVRKVGTPNDSLTLELCSDGTGENVGNPGIVRAWTTLAVASVTDVASIFHAFDWAGAWGVSANPFHINVFATSGSDDATNHWEVGTNATSGTTQKSTGGSNWTSAAVDLYFRLVDADDSWVAHFYEYKGQLYFATAPDDGSATQIFMNGDRGATDSNSGDKTKLNDGTKGAVWTASEWVDSVAVITDGTGSDDELNWRVITGNTTVALTSAAWDTAHSATATDYAIISSDKWTEISGSGLGKPVTDVLVSKGVIYYAQGDDTAHRRHREYNSSGTWTNNEWDDDGGSNKPKFLLSYRDGVSGQQVGMVTNDDANNDVSFARADAQVWGTDLTFGTPVPCGDRDERATGLELYGEPGIPYIMKEGSIWFVVNDLADDLALREMKSVRSYKNGRAHLVHGVYLYFSLLHSLQRYFRNNLDDVGYGVDAGLPADRQGVIYHMEGYPGYFMCAVDGGESNYSSILVTYGHQDWHELYRAPEKGQRIRRLHMQPIPGSTIDRLWFSMGPDVCWLPMPSDTFDPYRDSNYLYTHEGHIVSAWHYANMQDVLKFWGSLKVFAENLTADEQYIEAEYQIDDVDETDTWTAINGTFDTSPLEEVDIKSDNTVTARRFRFRLRFLTTDSAKTPKMTANLIEAIGTVKPKWEYSMTFRVADENVDIEGDDDSYVAAEIIQEQMDTWAGAQTPLTQRCVYVPYDNKTVFATALPLKPVSVITDEGLEVQVGQLVVYEK